MTISRMVGLLVGLALIGIAAVWLRADQARHIRQIQMLQFERTDLCRRIWAQEMEIALLRSPRTIRERSARFDMVAERPEASPGRR